MFISPSDIQAYSQNKMMLTELMTNSSSYYLCGRFMQFMLYIYNFCFRGCLLPHTEIVF